MVFDDIWNGLTQKKEKIGVVGLGYVGLPLACRLATKFKVVGFDIKTKRINELTQGVDVTNEVHDKNLILNPDLEFTNDPSRLNDLSFIIVAVPTPVDEFRRPDLTPLEKSSETIAKVFAANRRSTPRVVVYESTVYPGVTEDYCGGVFTKFGLQRGKDFCLGYSPERVNPGDPDHPIEKIVKIVSGESKEVTALVKNVYSSVITAGVFEAASIKTAEAAKVIENTQRDINIALINELAMLFDKIDVDTHEVLEAAGTKWNFMKFFPGLVGGHCIGVDPYYLTHLASKLNFHTELIEAGRRTNDSMPQYVAQKTLHALVKTCGNKARFTVNVLGVTFKENVPDMRNSKVFDLMNELTSLGMEVRAYDPVVDAEEYKEETNVPLCTSFSQLQKADALIIAVPHRQIREQLDIKDLKSLLNDKHIVIDLRATIKRNLAKEANINLWRL